MSIPNTAPIDFALLGHPVDFDHLGELVRNTRPEFDTDKLRRHRPTLEKFFEWTPSYPTSHELAITAAAGRHVKGRLIISTFLPQSIKSPRDMLSAYKKIVAGCEVAQRLGARIVGLGGFTSIVCGDQGRKLQETLGVAVTSGNSLTAAIALEQIESLLDQLEWDLASRTVAIVGATGDIGRACTFRLARTARGVLLIARNEAHLAALRDELPRRGGVDVHTDPRMAVHADVIVTATSATEPLLDEARLPAGKLVFDVGYPQNVRRSPVSRQDTLVVSVGRARLPWPLPLTDYTRLADPHLMYGCFTEAVVLALSGRFESYSTGQGCITDTMMANILSLAWDWGVSPAPVEQGTRTLDDAAVDVFLRAAAV